MISPCQSKQSSKRIAPWSSAGRAVAGFRRQRAAGNRLAVTFVDGTSGIADLSRLFAGNNAGIFAALAAPDFFAQVRLELGVITWPNGADLDPDWLHEEIATHGQWLAPA